MVIQLKEQNIKEIVKSVLENVFIMAMAYLRTILKQLNGIVSLQSGDILIPNTL